MLGIIINLDEQWAIIGNVTIRKGLLLVLKTGFIQCFLIVFSLSVMMARISKTKNNCKYALSNNRVSDHASTKTYTETVHLETKVN